MSFAGTGGDLPEGRLGRPARVDLAGVPLGRRARPTAASRSAPTRTRASSRALRPSARRSGAAATRELLEATMRRSAEGGHRWVYTLFPTNAYASDAEMSLREFEDFYFRACLADDPDPLTAWRRASAECERLAEWIDGPQRGPRRRRGHRHQARRRGAQVHPLRAAIATCPTASSSRARSRTPSMASSRSTFPP